MPTHLSRHGTTHQRLESSGVACLSVISSKPPPIGPQPCSLTRAYDVQWPTSRNQRRAEKPLDLTLGFMYVTRQKKLGQHRPTCGYRHGGGKGGDRWCEFRLIA